MFSYGTQTKIIIYQKKEWKEYKCVQLQKIKSLVEKKGR